MAPPADALVHGLKYGGWPELAPFMADRMARTLRGTQVAAGTVLVPVPTTPARMKERGYNQAELLARELARILGLSCVAALVRREGSTTQTALHRAGRLANVEGAFHPEGAVAGEVRGRPVLLVDDVLTTGATASAAARSLTECGASEVLLVAFARALPDDD
jgi:ComF family protein